ncbi:MAG: hypothetical protein AVDCRST_MAG68-1478, partial [uncultured Gemmatimonadetes bacterium]
ERARPLRTYRGARIRDAARSAAAGPHRVLPRRGAAPARGRGAGDPQPRAGEGARPLARALGRGPRGGDAGPGPHPRLRDPADAGDGAGDGGEDVQRVPAARHFGAGVARVAGGARASRRRAGHPGRLHLRRPAVPRRERLQRRGRRAGAGGVRQLRPDRGLRPPGLHGRVGARQDRGGSLRALLPGDQGARGGAARGAGADPVQRSAAGRARHGGGVPGRPHAPRHRHPARKRLQRQRRSHHPGGALRARGAAHGTHLRQPAAARHRAACPRPAPPGAPSGPGPRGAHAAHRPPHPQHPGGGDRLRQRGRAAARPLGARGAGGVAGRSPLPLPRGRRAGGGARGGGDGRAHPRRLQADLEHAGHHPRERVPGRAGAGGRAPRLLGTGRGRQRQRHRLGAGGRARRGRAGARRQPSAPHGRLRHLGRGGVGADRLHRVRGAGLRAPHARRRGLLQHRRVRHGAQLRRERVAVAAAAGARRGADGARPLRERDRVRGVAAHRGARGGLAGAGHGRPGGRLGLRALLQPPGDSARGLGVQRALRRVPLPLRLVQLDDPLRRSRLPAPHRRRADRRHDGAAHGQRGRASLRLRGLRAPDAALPAGAGQHLSRAGLQRAQHGRAARRHRPHGAGGRGRGEGARPGAGHARAQPPQPGARQRLASPGGAGAHAAARAALAPLVPLADLRGGREQRLRQRRLPLRAGGRAGGRPPPGRARARGPGGALPGRHRRAAQRPRHPHGRRAAL